MKKGLISSMTMLTALALFTFSFTSCLKDNCDREVTYINPVPVYKTISEIRQPVNTETAQEMVNPGKIYKYGSYLLINEINEGIHVVNNTDPSNPINERFIRIVGNKDIAVKNDVLYADNYIDLLAIDITNPNDAQVMNRVENAFPNHGISSTEGVLVEYDGQEVTEKVACDWQPRGGMFVTFDSANEVAFAGAGTGGVSGRGANLTGVAGSMARFTIMNDALYTVDDQNLNVFDISQASNPDKVNVVNLGMGIETIYPSEQYLFIGANNGMHIYDATDANNPAYVSNFWHATACDPVVVEGDLAYVTLRTGSECEGWINQLQVINIANITNPTFERSFEMTNPRGLSIDNGTLYLCDGDAGLKIFDVQNAPNLNQVSAVSDGITYDVIASQTDDLLMVIGEDGLYQYDKSNPNELRLLSKMTVK
ncbi:MAG: LVIVD repeat-containing protein [Chitinophagales bacterium]